MKLMQMVDEGMLTSRVAKDILTPVVFEGRDPEKMAEEGGLLQNNSEEELVALVEQIITEHETVVAEYKAGKETALKFLVGQGMKLTQGSANPTILTKLLQEKLQ